MNTYKGRALVEGKVPKNTAYVPVNVVSIEDGVLDTREKKVIIDTQDLKAGGVYASLEQGGAVYVTSTVKPRKLTDALHRMSALYPGVYRTMTELPEDLDASELTDASGVFADCANLQNFNLADLEFGQPLNLSEAFKNCSALTELDLGGLDTGMATDLGSLFEGCSGLTELDLNDLDTGAAVNLGGLFKGCSGLTELDLSDLDTGAAEDLSSMFEGCSGLTTLDVSTLDADAVEDLSGLFKDCANLRLVTVDDLTNCMDTGAATDTSSMFKNCGRLAYVDTRSLDTSAVVNAEAMFENCTTLATPATGLSAATVVDRLYAGCTGLPNTVTLDIRGATSAENLFTGSSVTTATLNVLPSSTLRSQPATYFKADGDLTLTINALIVSGAAYKMSQLYPSTYTTMTSITDKLLLDVGVTNLSDMFNGCTKLTSFDNAASWNLRTVITQANTAAAINMARMFKNCAALTAAPQLNTHSAVNMDELFRGCTGLTYLPQIDASSCTSMRDAFTDTGASAVTIVNASAELRAQPVTYFKADGELTITWKNGRTTVDPRMSVLYPETFTSMTTVPEHISTYALDCSDVFRGCAALISINNDVNFETMSITNFARMYQGCTALTTVAAPYIMLFGDYESFDCMFDRCTSLSSVTLNGQIVNFGGDANSFNSTFAMFRNCASLTTVPDLLTSFVLKNPAQMFRGCTALATVPKLNLSRVTTMWEMFRGCTSLPVTFPWAIDAASCVDMQDIFTGSSVTKVVIINASTALQAQPATYFKADGNIVVQFAVNLTSSFYKMSDVYPETFASMTTVPDALNIETLTVIDGMFAGCAALTAVPELDISAITSMDNVFNGCAALPASMTLHMDACTSAADAFTGSSVTSVTMLNAQAELQAQPTTYFKAEGVLTVNLVTMLTKSKPRISDVYPSTYSSITTVPGTLDVSNLTTDMSNMFNGCSSLTRVPELDTSNVTNLNYMFYGCSALTSLPELNTSKVTSMRNIFQSCSSLTEIPELDTSNVTDMYSAFQGCSLLTEIPALDTASVFNMANMFQGCSSLTEIPALDTSSLTYAEGMFENCTSLTNIPQLNTSKNTSMYNMFKNCSSLTSIPQLDTSKVTSMANLFYSCSSLTSIPQLDTSAVEEMWFMFCGCSKLTTVPQLNTSKVTNMQFMFSLCSNLPAQFPWTIDARACKNMDNIFNASSVTRVTIANASTELRAQPTAYFKQHNSDFSTGTLTITWV